MRKLNIIRVSLSMHLLILFNFTISAQSSLTFKQAMDSLLAPLDKTGVTTGILYERAKPLANIDLFNVPSADPYISDNSYFFQAYYELYNSAYNTNGWAQPGHLRAWAEGKALKGNYTVGILDYQFNLIDSNAVSNGLLTYTNGQYHNVPGAPSPYWTKRLQVAAILSEGVPGGQVSFVYDPTFIKTNQSITISSVQLNFGTAGVYTLSPTNPIVQPNFTGSGIKQFTVTVQYTNGTSFTHDSEIQISSSTDPYSSRVEKITAEIPDDSLWISSKYPYQGYGESQAYYAKAKVSIWWKKNSQNQPDPGIKKPVIIIDGFDPDGARKNRDIYDLFEYYNETNQKVNFADQLRMEGFDIIVMDMPAYSKNFPIEGTRNDPTNSFPYPKSLFDNSLPDNPDAAIYGGGDFQQRNAYVLEYLIDYCNEQMQINGSTEKLVIVGPSMGGQISRYALRDMEIRGQNHNCRLWVSFDSNNEGSYAPVGLQYSLNMISSDDDESRFKKTILIDCPEAKQSLLHHYLANSETVNGVPGFFDQYYNEVNSPSFGFPQAAGLRKIVMISGSDLGVPQTFGTACQLATKLEAKYRPRKLLAVLLFSPLAAITSPSLTHRTYLAPATGQCTILKFSADTGPDGTKKIYAPSWCNTSLDMVQGGFFPVFKVYQAALHGQRSKKWYKNPWKLYVEDYIGSQVQQLTYSTLAIGLGSMPDPTRKWDANFRIDKYNQPCDVTCPETQESPFEMYWGPDINTRHDSLLLGHVVRLRKEIIDKQAWQKTQIQRQSTIQASKNYMCNGESLPLSMVNPLPNMTYSWTTGNPNLQISGSGPNITLLSNGASAGYYVISCQASSPCYLVTANFTIHVGGYSSSDYPVSGPSVSCNNTYVYFSTNVLPGATDYVWFWPASNWTYISGNQTPYLALRTGTASGPVGVRVANACDAGGSPGIKFVQVNNCGWRFYVSPNPTNGNIIVSTTEDQKRPVKEINQIKIYQLRIIDQLGNVKKQYRYPSGISNAGINTSNLGAGVYVVQAYNGKSWEATKFVKQ